MYVMCNPFTFSRTKIVLAAGIREKDTAGADTDSRRIWIWGMEVIGLDDDDFVFDFFSIFQLIFNVTH